MPHDPPPFFKWDPDGDQARQRRAARHLIDGQTPEEADRRAGLQERRPDRLAGKRWLLRWAWLVSTGVLVLGYLILIALFAGWGDHLHLT